MKSERKKEAELSNEQILELEEQNQKLLEIINGLGNKIK